MSSLFYLGGKMLVHILRENENIEDLCKLYSISKERILKINRMNENSKIQVGQKIIIPIDDFYYFKRKEENLEDIGKKFNISKEEIYKNNINPLCFNDGSIRLRIDTHKKDIEVYSLVDLNLKSNAFIELDLESRYVNSVLGYNGIGNKDDPLYVEDYYLRKIHDVDKVSTSLIINSIKCDTYEFLADYICKNITENIYYDDVTLYYDLAGIDLNLLFDILNSKNIKTNILLDEYLFSGISNNEEIIEIINKNANKVFVLPNFISDVLYTSKEEYLSFLNKISVFDKNKVVAGFNLNNARNEDILEIIETVRYLYDMDFRHLLLYSSGNRFFEMEYILKHFFAINK